MRYILLLFFLPLTTVFSQQSNFTFTGKIKEQNSTEYVAAASIFIEGSNKGVISNNSGNFELKTSKKPPFTIVIKVLGYVTKKVEIKVADSYIIDLGEIELIKDTKYIDGVEITSGKQEVAREEAGVTKITPQSVKVLPSVFGDFNKILATLPGVTANNELSSTYSVRGGNYDENLVYVNGMEVYRPFLVRSGQQEGLSFINQEMVNDVTFSAGGWQAKYGDKLSSVLDVTYKSPEKLAGSVQLGMLGGSFHLENRSKNERVTYVTGLRNRQARYAFNALPIKGSYRPSFTDFQTFVTIDLSKRADSLQKLSKKTTLSILTSFARNRYFVIPEEVNTSFGSINNVKRLTVYYDGKENMDYDTYQGSMKLSHQLGDKIIAEAILSGVYSQENENTDVEGGYFLCQVNPDPASDEFNKCKTTTGAGTLYDHRRNRLEVKLFSFENRYTYVRNVNNVVMAGVKYNNESITDVLKEWAFIDSADYVKITSYLKTNIGLESHRIMAFAQQTLKFDSIHTFTYGGRLSFWSVNGQLIASPRLQYSVKPRWQRDVVFRTAVGVYQQAPFYRELRDFNGVINPNLKAQRSYHIIAGTDYNFKAWKRPFKLVSELYYKYIDNVIPYDVDNVRIRYYAKNNAVAYATGADFRVSGEFIKGAESWFSLGVMQTRENVKGDMYRTYANDDPNDTTTVLIERGWIRRPSDQRVTASIFFQDNIPNRPSLKVFLNLVFGTGLPFGPPNSVAGRAAFKIPPYRRVDIGFSKLISFIDKTNNKFGLESVWIGVDVLNVIGANNTISYIWIKDVYNTQYAVPNFLSQRFINAKVIVRF